jgi:hypothetical protein
MFFSTLLFALTARAHGSGQYGHLVSKGINCDVVDIEQAYFSWTGSNKTVVLFASIKDIAYEKTIYLQNLTSNHTDLAVWNAPWWQYPVAAKFESQSSDGRVNVRIINQAVGSDYQYTFNLFVQMNGSEYVCSDITVSVN